MSKSETVEHKKLKDLMYKKLCEWLRGSAVREYRSLGHELDIFHISYNGITIMVEVIWTHTKAHFNHDMIILLTSDARVKIIIVNPEILCNDKFAVSYEKVRISELLKGYLVSPMLDGGRILKDRNYFENHVREIILSLIDHATSDSKASYEHFQDIKTLVIFPLLEILRSKSIELPHFDKDEDSMFGVDLCQAVYE